MFSKCMASYVFPWPADEESEEKSSKMICQVPRNKSEKYTSQGVPSSWGLSQTSLPLRLLPWAALRSVRRQSDSLLPLSSRVTLPIPQHSIYLRTLPGGLSLSTRLWDPLWQTLCHLSTRPLGPEERSAGCRCRTRVCPGNDGTVLASWLLFLSRPLRGCFLWIPLFSECWHRGVGRLTQKYTRQCGFQP